jgi:hypothetical protein
VITPVGGNACLPDLFIPAGLQPELQEHWQIFARSLENIGEGLGHLHKCLGHGFVLCCFNGIVDKLQPSIQQGQEERLFAFEMMIKGSLADARLFANVVHTGFVITAYREQLDRCFHDFGPCLFTALLHLSSLQKYQTDQSVCFYPRTIALSR